VTLAAYLVPQVMAYAEVAGLPPLVGLWSVVGPMLHAASTALMTAAAASVVAAGQRARFANAAAVLAMAVGAICLLGWIGRLGFSPTCCLGRC
jgi:sulfate permease, SulP family